MALSFVLIYCFCSKVCDVDLNILNVNARFPGSSHDAWVFRNSPLDEVMQAAFLEDRCWLVGNVERVNIFDIMAIGCVTDCCLCSGDSGYPHRPWLMTPLGNQHEPGTPEAAYNRLHSKCRNPIERCNGVLKARWRCMCNDLALPYMPEKCGQIINASAVLHNILTSKRLPPPEDYQRFQDQPEPDNLVEPEENDGLPLEVLQDADAVRGDLIEHAPFVLPYFMDSLLHGAVKNFLWQLVMCSIKFCTVWQSVVTLNY